MSQTKGFRDTESGCAFEPFDVIGSVGNKSREQVGSARGDRGGLVLEPLPL